MRFLHGVVALAAGAALLAGCSTETEGEAKPVDHDLFDPCTISKDALSATGVDPATESRDVAGVKQAGWKICGWEASWYFLEVYSTGYTMADVHKNASFGGFAPVQIGSRTAEQFHENRLPTSERCDLALPAKQGAFLVIVDKKGSKALQGDPCQLVVKHARDLANILPQ